MALKHLLPNVISPFVVQGIFAGARGLITSNFTVSADGEVVDNHFVRLYLP